MTTLISRAPVALPDVFRWLESFAPMTDHMPVRIEDYMDDGNYVVRAELPGMTTKDIQVSTQGTVLTIVGERIENKHDHTRSEFRYGSFSRSVSLPQGADPKHIRAQYEAGVLRVTVPVRTKPDESRQIPVTTAGE